MKNLSKKQVIEFMFSEQEMGNALVSATLGNGGAGLDISEWSNESIQDLEDLEFDGIVEPCNEIEECEYYTSACRVYQFSDEDGFRTQIMTF